MRLIRQYSLHFSRPGQEKAKVFEVDLCVVGAGRFVVNYRYGRSGHALRDGTRTLQPLPADAAEQALEQLLNEKLRSGYTITAQYPPLLAAPGPAPESAPATSSIPEGRHLLSPIWLGTQDRRRHPFCVDGMDADAVAVWLERSALFPAREAGDGELARVAWRAGSLRLERAVAPLLALRHRSHGEDYAIAWALGRCGGPLSTAALESYLYHPSPAVGRIARSGLSQCLEGQPLAAHRARLDGELPAALREAEGGEARRVMLVGMVGDAREVLARLYLLGDRAAVMARLSALHIATGEGLAELRTLLQLAEHADDTSLFAAVAARLEESGRLGTTPAGARRLRERCWRVLRQQHADQVAGWRALALSLLLAFDDERHPHAADPRRRLHHALAAAARLLAPTGGERSALMAARCSWVAAQVMVQGGEH